VRGGERRGAHCQAWLLFRGEIPLGLFVLHKCDRPNCVNPDHLFLGTHTDNMRDAIRKGRVLVGDHNPMRHRSKLTMAVAAEIRARRAAGERGKDLAAEYGIATQTVCEIYKGRQWV
jgi:hypothetical protein